MNEFTITVELTPHEARALRRVAGLWCDLFTHKAGVDHVPPLRSGEAKLALALFDFGEPVEQP